MTTDTPPRGEPAPPEPITTDEAAGSPARQSAGSKPPTRKRTAFDRPAEDDREWRNRSLCAESGDPDMWFSPLPMQRLDALMICRACPVMFECGRWADKTGQHFGVWGGRDREVVVTAHPDGGEPAAPAGKRLLIVDRVRLVLREYPGSDLAQVAERLGYKSGGSLERTLYRRGDDGKALIRKLKPGSKNRDDITRTAAASTADHPWLTTAALPVNEQRTNVQYRKTGQPPRGKRAPRSTGDDGSTQEESAA